MFQKLWLLRRITQFCYIIVPEEFSERMTWNKWCSFPDDPEQEPFLHPSPLPKGCASLGFPLL
jgi:hypothetical protein